MAGIELPEVSASLREIARATTPTLAAQRAHDALCQAGYTRTAVYRLRANRLEQLAAYSGGSRWHLAPTSLAPVPDALSTLMSLEGPTLTRLTKEPHRYPELAHLLAVPLQGANEPLGVLLASTENEMADAAQLLLVADILSLALRLKRSQEELQTLRNEHYEQLLHTETLAAIGMLSAGVAHELNNPLGVVLGLAELLCLDEELSKHIREDLQVIVDETSRAVRVVSELMRYGREGELDMQPLCMVELTEACLQIFGVKSKSAGIEVNFEHDVDEHIVLGDQFRLQQSMLAILDNARYAVLAPGASAQRIDVRLRRIDEGRRIELRISDWGEGLDPSVASRIYDPFFTTRPVGTGTGMGLALVMRLVRDLRGDIHCEASPAGGASFVIALDQHEKVELPQRTSGVRRRT